MLRLSSLVIRNPRRTLLVVFVWTALFVTVLPRLELQTDGASLHPPDDVAVESTRSDRARFHDPETVILLVQTGSGSLRSAAGLRAIHALHDSLAARSGVRAGGIQSLSNLLDTRAADLGAGFLDVVPDDVAPLLERLDALPLAEGLYLARDGSRAALYVPIEGARRRQALAGLEAWIESQAMPELEMRLLGPVVAEARLGHAVLRDLVRLVPIAFGVIAAALFLALRSPAGVLIPLSTGFAVLALTFGVMAMAQVPVTLVSTILPVLLLALSITDAMHVLERLDHGLRSEPTAPVRDVVRTALRDVYRPVVATSVTTAIGFLAFCVSPLRPLRDFGAFASLGILLALLLTFVLVPALALVVPASWLRSGRRVRRREPDRNAFVIRRAGLGLGIALALGAAAVPGLLRLRVQDSWVDNFAASSSLVRAERDYNEAFWGSYRYDVTLEAEPGYFLRPEGVALVTRLVERAREAPSTGGVLAYTGTLGSIAEAVGVEAPLAQCAPEAIANLAALAMMAPERSGIMQLLTPQADAARLRLHVRSADYARAGAVDDFVRTELVPLWAGRRWHASGDVPVSLAVVGAVVTQQLRSLAAALAGIALALLVFTRSVRTTVSALVPVCLTAAIVLGCMSYVGLPLGVATSLFASVSLGVGIDFALHLLHGYREGRRAGRGHTTALASTLERAGRAIRWNALVLASGFAVLAFSAMRPDRSLGILLAAAMLAGYLSTLLCLPALLRWIRFALVAGLLAVPAASRVEAAPPGDPAATALMRDLEMCFRARPRLVRMRITSHFTDFQNTERTLFGAVDGDTTQTNLLYVFTQPQVLRGMSLLIRDPADIALADSIWLFMPAFERFRYLDPQNQKMLIPGTALTNEDARGFVPVDKYHFQFAPEDRGRGDRVLVAHPRSPAVRDHVGYASMTLRIDAQKRLVRRIDFTGLHGKPHKTYELLEATRFGDSWLPRRVRVEHLDLGFDSTLEFTYWPARRPWPERLFAPEVDTGTYLDRLRRVLETHGIVETEAEAAPPRR